MHFLRYRLGSQPLLLNAAQIESVRQVGDAAEVTMVSGRTFTLANPHTNKHLFRLHRSLPYRLLCWLLHA